MHDLLYRYNIYLNMKQKPEIILEVISREVSISLVQTKTQTLPAISLLSFQICQDTIIIILKR